MTKRSFILEVGEPRVAGVEPGDWVENAKFEDPHDAEDALKKWKSSVYRARLIIREETVWKEKINE